MKTPIQEFIDRLKLDFNLSFSNNIIEEYLEKEKQVIIEAFENWLNYPDGDKYYNEKFKQ